VGGEIFYAILPLSICRSNPSIHPFSQIHCFWSALSLWLQCGHPSALTFHSLNSAPLMMRHPILLSSLRPVEIEHLKWIKLFLKNYHNKITIHWDEHRRRHNWILFWKRLRLADNNLKINRINWWWNGRGRGTYGAGWSLLLVWHSEIAGQFTSSSSNTARCRFVHFWHSQTEI